MSQALEKSEQREVDGDIVTLEILVFIAEGFCSATVMQEQFLYASFNPAKQR